MTNKFKPIDSGKLQLESVIRYMKILGYVYLAPTYSFSSGLWMNRGRAYVSPKRAIDLHNGVHTEWHGRYFDYPFDDIPPEMFTAAQQAKIVYVAKLQHSRKKGIIVQNHNVKFIEPEEAKMYIKLLK